MSTLPRKLCGVNKDFHFRWQIYRLFIGISLAVTSDWTELHPKMAPNLNQNHWSNQCTKVPKNAILCFKNCVGRRPSVKIKQAGLLLNGLLILVIFGHFYRTPLSTLSIIWIKTSKVTLQNGPLVLKYTFDLKCWPKLYTLVKQASNEMDFCSFPINNHFLYRLNYFIGLSKKPKNEMSCDETTIKQKQK